MGHFWSAVERLSNEERGLLLKFATGRSRLPAKLKLSRLHTAADAFPVGHTCFYQLDLPPWRDAEMAYKRIRFAIYNCMEIDDD